MTTANPAKRGPATAELDTPRTFIIHGITESGSRFRPSDWAERLCGSFTTWNKDRRLQRSPYIRMEAHTDGKRLIVDQSLAREDRAGFEFLRNFARDNRLMIEEL